MAKLFSKALSTVQHVSQRAGLATITTPCNNGLPLDVPLSPFPVTSTMIAPDCIPSQKRVRQRHQLPASLMRAGTSRGLFIHKKYLPPSQQDWKPWILAAMGSKNNDARQIDGVGGATSTTSKVCVVEPSTRLGIDVEYTFIQVAVGKESLDFSGNCGNMASGIGPFAVEEGLVEAQPGQTHLDVSIYNTNTGKRLIETVELDDEGHYFDEGDYLMPGVKTPGSEVKVAFVEPAGSMTGKLFPTGKRVEQLQVTIPGGGPHQLEVQVSLVDAANPFVIVDASSIPADTEVGSEAYLDIAEAIRRAGAVRMGLASSIESAALVRGTPKIGFVSPAAPESDTKPSPDVFVRAMSMQKPHPSLQLTGAVCIGAAACIPGTVVHEAAGGTRNVTGLLTPDGSEPAGSESDCESVDGGMDPLGASRKKVRLAHASGQIDVDVRLHRDVNGEMTVESCSVSRTARKIFDGQILVSL